MDRTYQNGHSEREFLQLSLVVHLPNRMFIDQRCWETKFAIRGWESVQVDTLTERCNYETCISIFDCFKMFTAYTSKHLHLLFKRKNLCFKRHRQKTSQLRLKVDGFGFFHWSTCGPYLCFLQMPQTDIQPGPRFNAFGGSFHLDICFGGKIISAMFVFSLGTRT